MTGESNDVEVITEIEQGLSEMAEDDRQVVVEEPEDDGFKPQKFTLERQKDFILTLAETGNVSQAAKAAGISRRAAYDAKKASDRFKQLWEEAEQISYDRLVEEARNWATEGKVTYRKYDEETGEVVEERIDYSESILIRLLEARRPEEFNSDDGNELSGEITINVTPKDNAESDRELDDGG